MLLWLTGCYDPGWIIDVSESPHLCKRNAWLTNYFPHCCYRIKLGNSLKYLIHEVLSVLAATATAKSLQSCPALCDPIDGSPPGSPVPGILQARTLEWAAISFSNAGKWKVKVKSLSRVRPSVIPWTAAFQAPPSMGFSRQEYWSGVSLPSLLQYKIKSFFLRHWRQINTNPSLPDILRDVEEHYKESIFITMGSDVTTRKILTHLVGEWLGLLLWGNISHCTSGETEAQKGAAMQSPL